MINEKEIHYAISIAKDEIDYFIKYVNQLKKFTIDNRADISKINMNKIFKEVQSITLHINNLKKQEQELLKTLDKIYYGKHTE